MINIQHGDSAPTGDSAQPHRIVRCYHVNRSQNSVSDFRLSLCYHTHHTNVKSDCTGRRMTGIRAKPLADDNEKCHCLKMEFFFHKKRSFAISVCSDFGMRGGLLKPLTKYLYLCVLGKQTVTIKCPDRRVNKNGESDFSLSGPLGETLGFNTLIHQLFCDQHL